MISQNERKVEGYNSKVNKSGSYGKCLKGTHQKIQFIGKYNNIFAINDFVISAPRSMSL